MQVEISGQGSRWKRVTYCLDGDEVLALGDASKLFDALRALRGATRWRKLLFSDAWGEVLVPAELAEGIAARFRETIRAQVQGSDTVSPR